MCCGHSSIFVFQWIFFILAGNKDNYNILDEFEFRPDPTSDCEEDDTIIIDEMLDEPISASEIRKSIVNLKNNKSPGIDGIPAEFYKVACDKFSPFFEILFNKLYNSAYFPDDWAISIITPIHKKGNKTYLITIEALVYNPLLVRYIRLF